MKKTRRTALFWVPRILAVLTALFLGMFALDVFGEGYRLGELLLALFMHLIPSLLILIVLAIAWRWERVGGGLFILLGVFYIGFFWHPSRWLSYLVISGPLFLTGFMFIFSYWLSRGEDVSDGKSGEAGQENGR
jgi:hypothetical protein